MKHFSEANQFNAFLKNTNVTTAVRKEASQGNQNCIPLSNTGTKDFTLHANDENKRMVMILFHCTDEVLPHMVTL